MKTVALNVGHGPKVKGGFDPGATGIYTEREYCEQLAAKVKALVPGIQVVDRPSWGDALFAAINATKADVVISLHLNGANDPTANGTEVLYWHSSTRGKALAIDLLVRVNQTLQTRSRGIIPISKPTQRGYALFAKTNPTVILLESFFVSNPREAKMGLEKQDALAEAIANFIRQIQSE